MAYDRAALVALKEAVEAANLPEHDQDLAKMPRALWEHIIFANSGSTDAAIALLAAVLPGWGWRLQDMALGGGAYACVVRGDTVFETRAPTPARALLLAMMTALIEGAGE